MARMTRGQKWAFTTFIIGTALLCYGRLAFQEPTDNPQWKSFAFHYTNVETQSPWERLQARQYACLENSLYRNIPRQSDGDAAAFEEACFGDRVLKLKRRGGVLNPFQSAVAKAAEQYAEQKKYYYMAGFFWFLALIPWAYGKGQKFWIRLARPLVKFGAYCHDLMRKMSS